MHGAHSQTHSSNQSIIATEVGSIQDRFDEPSKKAGSERRTHTCMPNFSRCMPEVQLCCRRLHAMQQPSSAQQADAVKALSPCQHGQCIWHMESHTLFSGQVELQQLAGWEACGQALQVLLRSTLQITLWQGQLCDAALHDSS